MATIRKVRRRGQAIIRRKKVHISKTFWKKSDARFWADKTEAQIEVGSYLNQKFPNPPGGNLPLLIIY